MLFRSPRSVREGGADIVLFEVREVGEDILVRPSGGEKTNDGADRDPHASKARLAAHDFGRVRDTLEEVVHELGVYQSGVIGRDAARN